MGLNRQHMILACLVLGQSNAFSQVGPRFGVSKADTSLFGQGESSVQDLIEQDAWVAESFESSHPAVVGPKSCLIYDTTLRDGTQMESINASCNDKFKIVRRLHDFGMVDYMECGWPGSNPKDAEFFERAKTELAPEIQAKLVAFGSTKRKSIKEAKDDPQIQALLESGTPTVCIVAKGHLWQVTDILRAKPEENWEMIRDSVSYLVSQGRRVFVDLEHFFDGYKHDAVYAMECARVAAQAGAAGLVLCDTNGGAMPWEIEQVTNIVVQTLGGQGSGVTVGIHCHNDCGMAAANSVFAVKSGAGMVQGTINGIGERTGNADLCTVMPTLSLHVKTQLSQPDRLSSLTSLSHFVDETLNRSPQSGAPFVGQSAFAHKGGLHVAALERSPDSYQHIDPARVGNEQRILVSELSGRQNIIGKIKEAGVFGDDSTASMNERAMAILSRVKRLENIGYTFEGADASVHLMILHASEGYCPPFEVLDYSAQVFDQHMDSANRIMKKSEKANSDDDGNFLRSNMATARATVKVRTVSIDDRDAALVERLEVSDGNGPVDALASALLRALSPSNPYLANVELVDYKVRILDPESATGAATRVMIEFRDVVKDTTWTTVSVDRNVISASLNALIDGFEYALVEFASYCMLCWDDDDDEFTAAN